MDLQITLAIVDEMGGGAETARRMRAWMERDEGRQGGLRSALAHALTALAARLTPQPGTGRAKPATQS